MSALPEVGRTQRLQYQFTTHIRDPQLNPAPPGIEDRRMNIYRELVYANSESFVAANFPVIRTLYDDAAWHALVRDFFRDHRCHTPLFPEFGREFLRFLETRQQQQAADPPFLLELAHYEWAELALSLDEHDIARVAHDPDGDPVSGIAVVSPLAWALGYRFPVHRIGPDFRPLEPPETPTLLLLIRGRDDAVQFLEINALTHALIERLQENTQFSGLECLDRLLADIGASDAALLRDAGLAMLTELKAREAILGTRN